ncbi:MAG: outer membrane beta-barrel protein [Bacteroidia bacterium]
MKKLVYTFIAISFATSVMLAQDAQKGVRFGVFGRLDPAWYNMTTNANYSKGGAVLGTGFGLNLEFRISDVVSFQTGIGGDFDGGKIKYTYNGDTTNHHANEVYTKYILDKTPALVDIKGHSPSDYTNTAQYTQHDLTSRRIHTTYVTIPLLLKMKTKEIGGFKYFVDFGGHIGVLVGAKADDNTNDVNSTGAISAGSRQGLNMYKDCIPVRIGLNVGLGAEYRLAGTTSVYMSANFVNSFISVVKANSVYNSTSVDSQGNFTYASQSLKAAGIQINVGFLF